MTPIQALLDVTEAPTAEETRQSALTWARQAPLLLGELSRRTVRGVLIGTAGAGKSLAVQRLSEALDARARTVRQWCGDRDAMDAVCPDTVLVVDDLHELTEEDLAVVRRRAQNEDASLIVSSAPWPLPEAAKEILRQLEMHAPAVVLGQVTRSDILDHLDACEMTLEDGCVEHVLHAGGGLPWLTSLALRLHDDRDCSGERGHDVLDAAVAEQVVHRLDGLDPAVRSAVEKVCIAGLAEPAPGDEGPSSEAPPEPDDLHGGHAAGLLHRNGTAPPVVRSAVLTTLSTARLVDLCARYPLSTLHLDDASVPHDRRVTDALIAHARALRATHPARARDLYEAAVHGGADAARLAPERADAAWAAGDADAAMRIVESALDAADGADCRALASVAATVWSARAMMPRAVEVFAAAPGGDDLDATNALVATVACGASAAPPSARTDARMPSALSVSLQLLREGLVASCDTDPGDAALSALIRSAEMYTQSGASVALCELPAVIAALAALNLGRVSTAQSVLDEAIAGGHGGPWAQPRLLLWRAWVAVQTAHPADARELLERVSAAGTLTMRDALVLHAVRVALARRYEDAAGLESAWRQARSLLLRSDVDLFLLHPLVELVSAAARVGDAAHVDAHLARALEILDGLGGPSLWSAHVHWAGIQEGILLSRPDLLAPHAKALVSYAHHSPVAAAMATAGRVWTAVLAGTVDADAVAHAAERLSEVGLMWDAARLAGHGAARSDDRRVSARLLACARDLHPNDAARRSGTSGDEAAPSNGRPVPEDVLSDREIEVARLVIQGKTYAEIGETIFISPRTAEHHIAHIRRRIGAGSRSELIARLRLLLEEGDLGAGRGDQPP